MAGHLKFSKNPTALDYIGVLLMMFVSRSIVLWGNAGAALTYEVFFVFALFRFILKRGHFEGENSVAYTIILCTAICINRFLFNTNVIANMWIASILTCVSSLIFYASYDYKNFRKCFLDVLAVLLLFNIPIQLIDATVGMPFVTTSYIDEYHEGRMFLIYNLGKGARLCGIWGEPGVTQIFINTCFLLYAPKLRARCLTSGEKIKLVILLIALLMGTSTMGYLVLAVIIFSTFQSSFKKLSTAKKLLAIPVVAVAILLLFFSPAVQEKIVLGEMDNTGTSFGQRYSDNMACLMMAIDRPLTGYGFGTAEYEAVSALYDNFSNSNGVLACAARIGLWWVFLYAIFVLKAVKRLKIGIPLLFLLLIILMMESDEDFIEFPMSYLFLMNFGSYRYEIT